MKYFRLVTRATAALLWTLLMHNLFIRVPQIFFGKERLPKTIHWWGRGLGWIMGIRIHCENEQPKEMGDMIIANHMGFIDIPVMLTFFPAMFIIKKEMTRPFYFGKALIQQGHLFVDRADKKSMRKTAMKLMRFFRDGDRIIVFPEGRGYPKAERLPFQPGSFGVAKKMNKTVQPCVFDYLPDRNMLAWDVNRPMLSQLAELFGRHRIDVSMKFYKPQRIEGDPKKCAQTWHDIIEGELKRHDRERENRELS